MDHLNKSYAPVNSAGQKISCTTGGVLVHRTSCHRCGNIRKNPVLCDACVMTFCLCCERKLIAQYGEDSFIGGCVYCKKLCCCVNKEDLNYSCPNDLHCYKKCVIYRHRKRLMDHKPTPTPSTPLTTSLTVSTQTNSDRQRMDKSTYTPTKSISAGLYDTNASFLASSLGISGGFNNAASSFSNSASSTSSNIGGSGGASPFDNPWHLHDLCMDTPPDSGFNAGGDNLLMPQPQINIGLLSPAQHFLSPIVSPLSPPDSVVLSHGLCDDLSPCPMHVDLGQHGGDNFFTKSYIANFHDSC